MSTDPAVALMEAYLQVNGYFTVVEYPLLEARGSSVHNATDLDILAFRFAGAGCVPPRRGKRRMLSTTARRIDPALGAPVDRPDMIVGEVKEGRAKFNAASRDELVVAAGLARFGCCSARAAAKLSRELLELGSAETEMGHAVRMVAFGSDARSNPKYHTVSLGHVLEFLEGHLDDQWKNLHQAQLKQDPLAFLSLIRKTRHRA